MLQEATTFTSLLRRCEKAIRSMASANAEAGNAIKLVMSAPLPARWEETAAGAGGATAAPQPIGGPSFNGEVRAGEDPHTPWCCGKHQSVLCSQLYHSPVTPAQPSLGRHRHLAQPAPLLLLRPCLCR